MADSPRPAPSAGGGLLGRLFEPVRVAVETPGELAALAARGGLVFVVRRPRLLDVLYLRWFLRRHALPPLRAAPGLRGLPAALTRLPRSRRALLRALRDGQSSVLFLTGDAPLEPFAALVRRQRSLDRPISLVPALLLWSRRAQRVEGSVWDVLYGSPDAPSAFANLVAFLRNFRRAFLSIGRPVDLAGALASRPEATDERIAEAARGVVHQRLARALRAAVGPPLTTPQRVRAKVLRDRTLRSALARSAADTGRTPAAVAAESERCLREIASRYDPNLVRLLRAALTPVFRKLYDSVEVDEEGLARVVRAAGDAPLVFCPSHKSYVDFLVLPWLLYEHGLPAPHVAAGINLSFWPFGALARRGGAFFIRRSLKGDPVYTPVLRAYVKHLLRERFPQEFYLEGSRSRTGKLLPPRTGLLSMEVDAWLDGAAPDVLFVPVAIDYEQLIEATSYARELAGGEKRKESLRSLLGAVRVLFRRYQRVHVQFEPPISLRAVAAGHPAEPAPLLPAAEEGPAAGSPGEARRALVRALATRIAYGIGRAVTITPVGLVASALLSHGRRGLGAAELGRRVELLRYLASQGGARFARGLAGTPSDPGRPGPVADALRRLEATGLVRAERAAGETIYLVPDERRPLLDYHRNAVIHRFVAPAIVAEAVRAAGEETTVAAARHEARWLSRLLKLEFTYRPGASSGEVFDEHLAALERLGAVAVDDARLRRAADRETIPFLAAFLRPPLEAYWLVADSSAAALGGAARQPAERRALVRLALDRGRAAYLSGRLAHRESLSRATIENAIEWLVSTGHIAASSGPGDRVELPQSGPPLSEIIDGIARHLAQ